MRDHNTIYEDFWKPILEKDGVLDLDQMKRELGDWRIAMEHVSAVYCHVTADRLSKPLYRASDVISVADEVAEERTQEAITEFLEEYGIPDPRDPSSMDDSV